MACILHNCKCGEMWFDNEVLNYCPNCGDFNKGDFDENKIDDIREEVADIEEGEENE